MTNEMPLLFRIQLYFMPKNHENMRHLANLYLCSALTISSGVSIFMSLEKISRFFGGGIMCTSFICFGILLWLNNSELNKDWDKEQFKHIVPDSGKDDILSKENQFTGDLLWEQFSEQLRKRHKKEGRSEAWTRVCLNLAEKTNQNFVSVFFNELVCSGFPSKKSIIFSVPSKFILEQIQHVPYETVLHAINKELPWIEEVLLKVKNTKNEKTYKKQVNSNAEK